MNYQQQFKAGLKQTTGTKVANGINSLIDKGKNLFSDDEKKKKEEQEQQRRQKLPTQRQ